MMKPPTREEHAQQIKKELELTQWNPDCVPDTLWNMGIETLVQMRVDSLGMARHHARVAFAKDACYEAALGNVSIADLGDENERNSCAGAVALLALLGQGGHKDAGGPWSSPHLPLLQEPLSRWKKPSGQTWLAALKEVASGYFSVSYYAVQRYLHLFYHGNDGTIVVVGYVEEDGQACFAPDLLSPLRRLLGLNPTTVLNDPVYVTGNKVLIAAMYAAVVKAEQAALGQKS